MLRVAHKHKHTHTHTNTHAHTTLEQFIGTYSTHTFALAPNALRRRTETEDKGKACEGDRKQRGSEVYSKSGRGGEGGKANYAHT